VEHRVPATALSRTAAFFLQLLDRYLVDGPVVFRIGDETHTVAAHAAGVQVAAPLATIRVHRERFFARVLGGGNLGFGEAYMDGDFVVEHGALHELLALLLRSRIITTSGRSCSRRFSIRR
jgi:hypothetical protein